MRTEAGQIASNTPSREAVTACADSWQEGNSDRRHWCKYYSNWPTLYEVPQHEG
ncbi:MAG: hypothetical protein WBF13_10740 [Candidatus Zixiibacteriota bacterium]